MKGKYKLHIPDYQYYADQVACRKACPVGTDAGGYVQAIAQGRYERAYAIARGPNPFASVCGWVCNAPCETACTRGNIDAPVTIRALKRFVTEKFGAEAVSDPASTLRYSTAPGVPYGKATGPRIAIVGGGGRPDLPQPMTWRDLDIVSPSSRPRIVLEVSFTLFPNIVFPAPSFRRKLPQSSVWGLRLA